MSVDFLVPYSLEIALSVLIVAMITCDTALELEEKSTLWGLGAGGCLAILAGSYLLVPTAPEPGAMWALDSFAIFFKRFFLLAGALVLLQIRAFAVRFRHGEGEYYHLALLVALGGMILSSAKDWIVLFTGLELMTIPLFVLVSWSRRDGKSLEAGVKYLIIGTFSSAFLLYGITYLYGYTGSLRLGHLELYLAHHRGNIPSGVMFGLLMVLSGIAFKMAAFPFHVWAPDVYEGAPTPTTAILAVSSKAAGFLMALRIFVDVMAPARDAFMVSIPTMAGGGGVQWVAVPLLAILAAITVAYGSLAAIPQWNLKRLMGYSSIGHAGYLLMGLAVGSELGVAGIGYYLLAYLFTNYGMFLALACMDRYSNDYEIDSLAGLGRRSPLLGITVTFSLLSLAGIPPFAGFFAKLVMLMSAFEARMYWLAVLGMIMVVPAMYVYLNVLKQVYAVEPTDPEPIEIDGWSAIGCYIACTGMVVIGLFQGPFMRWAERAAESLLK